MPAGKDRPKTKPRTRRYLTRIRCTEPQAAQKQDASSKTTLSSRPSIPEPPGLRAARLGKERVAPQPGRTVGDGPSPRSRAVSAATHRVRRSQRAGRRSKPAERRSGSGHEFPVGGIGPHPAVSRHPLHFVEKVRRVSEEIRADVPLFVLSIPSVRNPLYEAERVAARGGVRVLPPEHPPRVRRFFGGDGVKFVRASSKSSRVSDARGSDGAASDRRISACKPASLTAALIFAPE